MDIIYIYIHVNAYILRYIRTCMHCVHSFRGFRGARTISNVCGSVRIFYEHAICQIAPRIAVFKDFGGIRARAAWVELLKVLKNTKTKGFWDPKVFDSPFFMQS